MGVKEKIKIETYFFGSRVISIFDKKELLLNYEQFCHNARWRNEPIISIRDYIKVKMVDFYLDQIQFQKKGFHLEFT